MDTYDKTPMPDDDILNAHIRLGQALASSGLSISLTSFCSSMAFFVGSVTDIPGISSFCMYAAWSFLANYILQFLLFVPLMVIDDKRIRNKKNFCFPCCISHDKKLHNKTQIDFFDPEKIVKNNGSQSATKYKSDPTIIKQNSAMKLTKDSKCIDKCNAEYLMQITLIPMMKLRICRIIIIIFFICTLIGSLYVAQFLNTVSDATKLVPDDSYVLDFIDSINEIYTGTVVDELQIIIQNKDFSQKDVRDNILNMMNDMQSQELSPIYYTLFYDINYTILSIVMPWEMLIIGWRILVFGIEIKRGICPVWTILIQLHFIRNYKFMRIQQLCGILKYNTMMMIIQQ